MKTANIITRVYAITVTLVTASLLYITKTSSDSESFEEIDVKRINIIEPDGRLTMVISNSEKQHPGMFDGEKLEKRSRPAGLIFFNEEQDEVGGLLYEGSKVGAGMVLSFDQYKNDQVMQLQYARAQNRQQQYGLNIWDRSEKFTLPELLSVIDSLESEGIKSFQEQDSILLKLNNNRPVDSQRLFAGKTFENEVGLFIKDEYGNERIRVYVDQEGQPVLQFLDNDGNVIKRLPN